MSVPYLEWRGLKLYWQLINLFSRHPLLDPSVHVPHLFQNTYTKTTLKGNLSKYIVQDTKKAVI